MYRTLLGEAGFKKGMVLYFERHDGGAVTCDDFRAAMAGMSSFYSMLLPPFWHLSNSLSQISYIPFKLILKWVVLSISDAFHFVVTHLFCMPRFIYLSVINLSIYLCIYHRVCTPFSFFLTLFLSLSLSHSLSLSLSLSPSLIHSMPSRC